MPTRTDIATHDPVTEQLLSRKEVARRWNCSPETIKRRQREGVLRPIKFNERLLRYRLSDIIRIEEEGSI